METTQFILNKQLITFSAEPHIIKLLNEDSIYLARYISKASQVAKLNSLFNDPIVNEMVVTRVPASRPVWIRKGKPSADDLQATSLLLQLRASEKYVRELDEIFPFHNQLWEEIALEMKAAGFEVDGPMCAKKFQNLTKSYYRYQNEVGGGQTINARPRFYKEVHNILANNFPVENGVGDEMRNDSISKSEGKNERKRSASPVTNDADSEIWEFLQGYLKRNTDEKDLNYQEILIMLKRKTNLLKQDLEQNERTINMLETLVGNTRA